jgi:hypothetical protein
MSKWKSNGQFKYTPSNKTNEIKNHAKKFTNGLVKSEMDRINSELNEDYKKILNDGCFYLPNFFCETSNRSIFNELKNDLEKNKDIEMIHWNKHYKFENPQFSKTFSKIVEQMASHFKVEIYQTRLNFYQDGSDYKTVHRDSHAYGGKALRENFTAGASFGDSRELVFIHEATGKKFSFPQNNGDIFAFTSDINSKFLHGVPKTNIKIGPRFSIILWGRTL